MIIVLVSVIQKSFRYANYIKFMQIMSNLCIATKLLRIAIFWKLWEGILFTFQWHTERLLFGLVLVTYGKIVIWLGFRSRVLIDITRQQSQINKYQNIETKKKNISNWDIYW